MGGAACLAAFEQRCSEAGLPVTLQRRAVLRALLARDDHPTPDEVHADLVRDVDGVSRATVYRTLETLAEHGLLTRVCHPGAVARYDVKTRRHHHLVCESCGSINDFEEGRLDRIKLPEFGSDFEVHDFSVHVRGLCRTCSADS